MNVPKMRTLKAAVAEIKARDKDSDLSEYALRHAVISGKLPSVKAGNKYLINMDILEEYLSGNPLSPPVEVISNNPKIRQIF